MNEDSESDIIFLLKEVNDLKQLIKPLADDGRTGVALMWGSPLQNKIRDTVPNKKANK